MIALDSLAWKMRQYNPQPISVPRASIFIRFAP